jgi:hypothetical protein
VTGRQYTDAERDVLAAAHVILHGPEQRKSIRPEMVVEVAAFLLVHPDANANAVAAYVRVRRADVLSVVKAIRQRARAVPGAGYHVSSGGSSSEDGDGEGKPDD